MRQMLFGKAQIWINRLSGYSLLLSAGMAFAWQKPVTAENPPAPSQEVERYRLGPGDTIVVRFFFNPELNDEIQIRPDGRMSMQLIGEVDAGKKPIAELARELEARYAGEIKSPRITIQVRTYGNQKVYVTGEVERPGVLSLIGGLDVVTAIAESGGVKQAGKSRSVILIRRGSDGRPIARQLSLGSHSKPQADSGLRLEPFDVIVVPPRVVAKLDRWVDEYIKQLSPANLAVGFQYLYNRSASSVSVIPF